MSRVVAFSFVWILAANALGQQVSSSLDRTTTSVGESVNLSIVCTDFSPSSQPVLPSIPGLRFTSAGTSRQFQFNNGKRTSSYTINYLVSPLKPGNYSISPIQVRHETRLLRLKPLTLRVLPAGQRPENEDGLSQYAFVRLLPGKTEAYVGEVIPVEIQLYYIDGVNVQLPELTADGFNVAAFPKHKASRMQKGNRIYQVLTFQTAATPLKAGELQLGPLKQSMVLRVRKRQSRRSPFNDPFDGFFDRYQQVSVELEAEAQSITVKPLPSANQPAGFNGAVAPLGTALTEGQIQLLWKINSEAVLCLDGDAAGARAATRAAEKALPFLKPGYGLRFAQLPEGTDPDDLLKLGGAQAIQKILDEAQPLSEMLWHLEAGARLPATAEARAGVEARLKDHTRRIQDPTIRAHFSRLFSERLWPTREKNRNWPSPRSTGRFGAHSPNSNMHLSSDQLGSPLNAREIRHMALIATLINHPDCFDEIGEALGTLAFSTQELDILRQQVLNTLAEKSGLDSAGLITHLNQSGFAEVLGRVLSPHVYGHGFFARPNTSRRAVLSGWKDALKMFRNDDLAQEIMEAKRVSQEKPSEEASRQLQILTRQKLALQAEEEDALSNI